MEQKLIEIVKMKYGRTMAKMQCNICGAEFMIDIRLYRKGNGVVCSPECRCKAAVIKPVHTHCLNCGRKLKHVTPSGKRNPRQIFCNRRCSTAFSIKILTDDQREAINAKRRATWERKKREGWTPNAN